MCTVSSWASSDNEMGAVQMSMWIEDLTLMDTDTLEGLCDELEMKIAEGRDELERRADALFDDPSYLKASVSGVSA